MGGGDLVCISSIFQTFHYSTNIINVGEVIIQLCFSCFDWQNSKKSWHTKTLKNQERVWKAEQNDAAEKRKMVELQKEIAEERNREELKRIGESSGVLKAGDNKKMEWMYKADKLNREDYLTGRAIDKHFEREDATERNADKNLIGVSVPKNHVEHECIPFSIRAFQGAEEVGLANFS